MAVLHWFYDIYIFFVFQNGEILCDAHEHNKQINDLQMSLDMSMLISASKDTTAKVCSSHF